MRDLGDYKMVLTCEKFISTDGEPDNELDELVVDLLYNVIADGEVHSLDEEPKWIKVGHLHATVAKMYRAEPMFESCDCHSQEMYEAWNALYKLCEEEKDGEIIHWEEERDDDWDFGCGFVYIEDVRVDRTHRGNLLGLLLISRVLEMVEDGCIATLMRAWPEDFHEMSKDELKRQTAGLAAYFGLMGFQEFRDDFLVLKSGVDRPDTATLEQLWMEKKQAEENNTNPTLC